MEAEILVDTDLRETIIVVIHSPLKKETGNNWNSALWHSYNNQIEQGVLKNVIVLSAPTVLANTPGQSGNILYSLVDCPHDIFVSAKSLANDVFIWDLIHLMHPRGEEPYLNLYFDQDHDKYKQGLRDFFLYSIATATSALKLGMEQVNPVFHLNDPHDSFASALFEGNYDHSFLYNLIGDENTHLLREFERVKSSYICIHKTIQHTRFWHVPAIDLKSFESWFDKDPIMASHLFAGVFSSPLNVHASKWKKDFDKLFSKFSEKVAARISGATINSLNKGIGVGPIGYDPQPFMERFVEYDSTGKFQKTPEILAGMAQKLRNAVGELEPIIVFLTCRGDDPKNNLIETVRALQEVAKDPEIATRLVLVSVFNSSRQAEHDIYKDTLNKFKFEVGRLADQIGVDHIYCVEQLPSGVAIEDAYKELTLNIGEDKASCFELLVNGDSNLPHQAAGFMLSNMFACAARGGFDVVGVEAAIVASLSASGRLARVYKDILELYQLSQDAYHLVLADTAGSAKYLQKIFPNVSLIKSTDSRMPTAERIVEPMSAAVYSMMERNSFVESDNGILPGIDEVCSASACIEQWTASAVLGNPGSHPRSISSIALARKSALLADFYIF